MNLHQVGNQSIVNIVNHCCNVNIFAIIFLRQRVRKTTKPVFLIFLYYKTDVGLHRIYYLFMYNNELIIIRQILSTDNPYAIHVALFMHIHNVIYVYKYFIKQEKFINLSA